MNRQELVEKAISFYKSGGKPGWDGSCVYHGAESNELCAVGCLLRDPESFQAFSEELEDNYIGAVYDIAIELERADIVQQIEEILPEDVTGIKSQLEFLRNLQRCHDQYADESLEEFLEGFEAMAREMLAASLAGEKL